jgi:hypothetical protein
MVITIWSKGLTIANCSKVTVIITCSKVITNYICSKVTVIITYTKVITNYICSKVTFTINCSKVITNDICSKVAVIITYSRSSPIIYVQRALLLLPAQRSWPPLGSGRSRCPGHDKCSAHNYTKNTLIIVQIYSAWQADQRKNKKKWFFYVFFILLDFFY